MESVRRRGETIHSNEREVIRHVMECCDKEAREKSLLAPIERAQERAAIYCKVSTKTIQRIRKQSKETPNEKLNTPGKKRKRPDNRNAIVDDFDRRVILDVIREFYTVKKVVPTCKKLLPVLHEKIGFQWSDWTLRRILKEMGFRWRKCGNKRKILIEREDIVNWRCDYLRQIKDLRSRGAKIFYLDETWVDSNLTFRRCWQSADVDGVLPDLNSSNRLIIVDIGSEDGFLPGGRLIYRANTTSGDYHGQMNRINFEKWIRCQVLPNLPPNSVVVLDNAPYHSEQLDKVPTKSSTKKIMLEWLQKKGRIFEEKTTRKAMLLEVIEQLKPTQKVYKIDNLFKSKGHTVLRLPPYMCDLNVIEFVWAAVKHSIRIKNTTGGLSLTALQVLVDEALAAVTPSDWKKYNNHIINIEKEYWSKDSIMEDAVDELVIRLGEDSSSDSSSSSDEDEGASLGNENVSFSELAEPLPDDEDND